MPVSTYSCDDCGGALGENANVCPNCGKRWDVTTPSNNEKRLYEKLDIISERLDKLTTYVGWFWWLCIGIPLLALIVFIGTSIIRAA